MKTLNNWFICGRQNKNGSIEYINARKGSGGIDWGYCNNVKDALSLPTWWTNRFRKECEYLGNKFICYQVNS